MNAAELHTFAAQVLRRPLKPFTGDLVIHESAEELATAFKAKWPKQAGAAGWMPPAGFYDPVTGAIHVNRRAGVMTALHEIIHRSSRELFPLGRQIWGHFLDEGMTEAVVRWKLGPRLFRHAYDPHVRFVEQLASLVGPDLIERAVVHGDYPRCATPSRTCSSVAASRRRSSSSPCSATSRPRRTRARSTAWSSKRWWT